MQKKTIACDNYSIAKRLRSFKVSADMVTGHVDSVRSQPYDRLRSGPVVELY